MQSHKGRVIVGECPDSLAYVHSKDKTCRSLGMDCQLQGDVYSEETRPELEKRLRACTPVPGGIDSMTIAMLMQNVLDIYKLRIKS